VERFHLCGTGSVVRLKSFHEIPGGTNHWRMAPTQVGLGFTTCHSVEMGERNSAVWSGGEVGTLQRWGPE
jgi:hypothetical protein